MILCPLGKEAAGKTAWTFFFVMFTTSLAGRFMASIKVFRIFPPSPSPSALKCWLWHRRNARGTPVYAYGVQYMTK